MHTDEKSTLASVSKWNSGKVNWSDTQVGRKNYQLRFSFTLFLYLTKIDLQIIGPTKVGVVETDPYLKTSICPRSRSNTSTCLSEDDALRSQWRKVSVVTTRSLFGFICPRHRLNNILLSVTCVLLCVEFRLKSFSTS